MRRAQSVAPRGANLADWSLSVAIATSILHPASSAAWRLSREQHDVIAHAQLRALGFTPSAIRHRVTKGRLFPLFRGVYAVGRRTLSREGWWMAAVLAAGEGAVLSHGNAAALWGIRKEQRGPIHVSIPLGARRNRPAIAIHRRSLTADDVAERDGIAVTSVIATITDLATQLRGGPLEAAINQADILSLASPQTIRAGLDAMPPRPGKTGLASTIDRRTFRFTRSELERRFIPLAVSAGLPRPETRRMVNGYEVDFYWPDLRLVVETDSLTFHRTMLQQTRDRERDHAHFGAAILPLRFTHSQIRYSPGYVRSVLARVARRLAREVRRELEQVGHG